jgi:hypothetical protein
MMRGVFKPLSTARAAVAVGGAGRNPQLLATALGFCDAQVIGLTHLWSAAPPAR